MLKLFHTPTTRALRVVWLLDELGLPYEIERVRFPARQNAPDYLAINPSGTVPALQDGDLVLTESMAICEHLAQKRPAAGLVPREEDPDRAAYLKWLWFGEATLMFAVSLINRSRRFGVGADNPLVADTMNALDARLADFEQHIEGKSFAACGRFTLADISCVFPLYRLHDMKLADRLGPASAAYYDTFAARPGFARALQVT